MDQNKQKILIGVLAVVALGAGSYYFIMRDTSAPVQQNVGEREVRVRERNIPDADKDDRRVRDPRTTARTAPEVRERRLPAERERDVRRRASRGEKLEKKKEIKPAA